MARASTWPENVARFLLAPLVALWPVLCCCTLPNWGAPQADESVAPCHEDEADDTSEGRCCHGSGGEQDCSCPTALSTLADVAPAPFEAPELVLCEPSMSVGIVIAEAWRVEHVTRVEHPPPLVRRGRRVLRI
jgi:hypothetical protein